MSSSSSGGNGSEKGKDKWKKKGSTHINFNNINVGRHSRAEFSEFSEHHGIESKTLSSTLRVLVNQQISVIYSIWINIPDILEDNI